MKVSDLLIEVRDINLVRVGQVLPKDARLSISEVLNEVGTWELEIQTSNSMHEALLAPGAGIVVTDKSTGETLISGPTTAHMDEDVADEGGRQRRTIFTGVSDNIHLRDRLAWSNPNVRDKDVTDLAQDVYDERMGTAEDLIHAYVNANLGPGATPERRLRGIIMESSAGRGEPQRYTARYESLLELCDKIGRPAELTFRISQTYADDGRYGLVFETGQGVDRTRVLRLATSTKRLKSATLQVDAPSQTRAMVAVSDDSAGYVLVNTDESEDAEDRWGRRIESFSIGDGGRTVESLTSTGLDSLAEGGHTNIAVQAVTVDHDQNVYGVDWNMGDWITVQVGNTEYRAQVSGFVLELDDEGVLSMGITTGDTSGLSLETNVTAQVSKVEARLSNLERSVDPRVGLSGGSALIPTGALQMFAGLTANAPDGWIYCNGQAVSRTQYSNLFSVIGTTYGSGDGSSTFNVPDMRGHFPRGSAADAEGNVGHVGGSEKIGTQHLPGHTHSSGTIRAGSQGSGHSHQFNMRTSQNTQTGGTSWRVTNVGDATGGTGAYYFADAGAVGSTHEHPTYGETGEGPSANVNYNPPFVSLNFIIKT